MGKPAVTPCVPPYGGTGPLLLPKYVLITQASIIATINFHCQDRYNKERTYLKFIILMGAEILLPSLYLNKHKLGKHYFINYEDSMIAL